MKQPVKKSATKKIGAGITSKPIKYNTKTSTAGKVVQGAKAVTKVAGTVSSNVNRAGRTARNTVRSAATKSSPLDKLSKNKKVRRRLGYIEV